ncbi:hypothetical protein CYLTODRAFT_424641 [Cylindrobasidium torrendii FP15055 ss-10]|uniref:DASH complex subunit DAM1 n=1 Tax=Cylindrobasidium torrendii FP15055 ss-10 TaxID=1314674 RepID=A0A0D7B3E1_9AGAR|nr:hypothetical protein CYLTODRAFT_424641 [Cylindrobasidium torrendii FP15055 ss-10]
MSYSQPPLTPLRRVSRNSLFRLSQSGNPDAPHGLGFLDAVMAEMIEDSETLVANTQALARAAESLDSFNEAFAAWLHVMDMNALTTDWPQAPNEVSYLLAQRRAEESAVAAMQAAEEARRRAAEAAAAERTAITEAEQSYMTENTTVAPSKSSSQVLPKKKIGKKKQLTAKEKRERGVELERIINSLPLEFRGSDPGLRKNMEMTIEGLWDANNQAATILTLVKPPELPQARVNKCLIVLVNRKVVKKENSTGQVLYHWQGLPT